MRAEAKASGFSLTATSPSKDHQVCDWRWTRPKEIEDLAACSVKEVKSAAVEEREERSVFQQMNRVNQSKWRSSYAKHLIPAKMSIYILVVK